jgi:hypothetical protein
MTLKSNDDIHKMQDFADSDYHRPHDPQVTIPAGPPQPYDIKEDGSWEEGDVQVIKRSSLRRRRTVLTWSVIAFTIGSLMIVLSSPYSKEFLAPGPLNSSHAQLLAGQGADRCAACHSGSTSSAFGWVAHAFSGASNKLTQSELCLECHKSTMNEQFALNPHNVDPSELSKKSATFRNASFVSNLALPPVSSDNEIACSACHREHKGNLDLKAMTDSQCQSCHSENYHSFEDDHPEFTNWPQPSRQQIAFDHSTHSGKHFPSKNTSFDCSQCHLDDAYKNAKIQAPFEQACASCHEKSIVDSGMDGFALFALPVLDMKAIEAQDLDVASWPLAATGGFDGPLPAAMRLLLMADPDANLVLATKPNSFDFSDFDPDSESDVAEAVTLVWSIKRLLYDLSLNGGPAMNRRLDLALGREVDAAKVNKMLAGLDAPSFAAAARRWLPSLGKEVKAKFGSNEVGASWSANQHNYLARMKFQEQLAENPLSGGGQVDVSASAVRAANDVPQLPVVSAPSEVAILHVNRNESAGFRSGWMRDDRTLQIAYRPAGHDDEFLKHWIEMVLANPNADTSVATGALYESLTEVSSIGNCRYCHTLKRNEDQSLVMNWKASRRDGAVGQFTNFSHRPHLIQPELQDCSHCHRMDSSVSNNESFTSLDQLDYRSNFSPIEKANCSKCHQKGLTTNSCTTCHNYHVGGHKSQ